MTNNQIALGVLAAIVLIGVTAAASSYITKTQLQKAEQSAQLASAAAAKKVVHKNHTTQKVTWDDKAQPAQQAPVQTAATVNCDDNNIVGTVAGGVGGGLVGSRFGKGNGKTATTIAGTLGGAALGNQLIPTRNVTCR